MKFVVFHISQKVEKIFMKSFHPINDFKLSCVFILSVLLLIFVPSDVRIQSQKRQMHPDGVSLLPDASFYLRRRKNPFQVLVGQRRDRWWRM